MIIVSRNNFDESCLRNYEYKSLRDSFMTSILYFGGLVVFTIVYFVRMFLGEIEYYVMPLLANLITFSFLAIVYVVFWKSIRESKEQLDRYRRNEMKASYYKEGVFEVIVNSGMNDAINYYFNGTQIESTGMKLASNRRYNGHMVRMYFYSYNNKSFLMVDFG